MRKAIIIILAVVVALSALPITFACYNGGWGNWFWFWQPDQPVYCCPTYCDLKFFSESTGDNEDIKDVADTDAYIDCCGKKLVITIDNAYPGYEGIIDFCVKNSGSLAATITGITTDVSEPGYLQIDLTGEVQVGTVVPPCSWGDGGCGDDDCGNGGCGDDDCGDDCIKCGQLVVYGLPQEGTQNQHYTFTVTIDYDCTCVPKTCETAFAYGKCKATCFSHWGFTRWGWTNGPLGSGNYTFDIIAGAGSCNPLDGEKVGTLTVNYNGSRAIVTYNITHPDYTMDETHLYVGKNPLPKKNGFYTVSPGQFPYSHDLHNATTDVYTINCLCGNIYVVAHATVCR